MPRYQLRTLLIVLFTAPAYLALPVLAIGPLAFVVSVYAGLITLQVLFLPSAE